MERLTKRESANVGGRELVLCNRKKEDCNDSCMYETNCKWQHKALRKLKEYEDAEEQGLLLRLPVPCGEWVYSAECGIVAPYIVASYSNDKHGLWCLNVHGGLIGLWGTSVFKTHKEAEQALAKMKEGVMNV